MSAAKITTINPATEEVLNNYDIMTDVEINSVVKKSRDAYSEWKKTLEGLIFFMIWPRS